jgi:hypothetical protein
MTPIVAWENDLGSLVHTPTDASHYFRVLHPGYVEVRSGGLKRWLVLLEVPDLIHCDPQLPRSAVIQITWKSNLQSEQYCSAYSLGFWVLFLAYPDRYAGVDGKRQFRLRRFSIPLFTMAPICLEVGLSRTASLSNSRTMVVVTIV